MKGYFVQLLGDDSINVSGMNIFTSQSTGPCLPRGPDPPMQPDNGALYEGWIRGGPVVVLRLGSNSGFFLVLPRRVIFPGLAQINLKGYHLPKWSCWAMAPKAQTRTNSSASVSAASPGHDW